MVEAESSFTGKVLQENASLGKLVVLLDSGELQNFFRRDLISITALKEGGEGICQVVVIDHHQLERKCKIAARDQRWRRPDVLKKENNCNACHRRQARLQLTSDACEVRRR